MTTLPQADSTVKESPESYPRSTAPVPQSQSVTKTSRLLINEHPLQIIPSLAVIIGLNEAIVLQQIHYWLDNKRQSPALHQASLKDGEFWVYNSVPQWNAQFPFWGDNTIRRTLESMRRRGVLVAASLSDDPYDRSLWYRIDYAALDALTLIPVRLKGSSGKEARKQERQNDAIPIYP